MQHLLVSGSFKELFILFRTQKKGYNKTYNDNKFGGIRMKRRLLAAVLSAVMFFTSVNIEAFAIDVNGTDEKMMKQA